MVEGMRTQPGHCVIVVGLLATIAGCASAPRIERADVRRQLYLAAHQGISADLAAAIDSGHVLPGMDRDQVRAVLGQPIRVTEFSRSHAEIWLFPASRLHQDKMHSHGAASFRLVFIDQRLSTIDPI